MTGNLQATVAPQRRATPRRAVVDLTHVLCVLVPLLVVVASLAWYLALTDHRLRDPGDMVGLLVAGWIPWLLATVGTVALASVFGVERDLRGHDLADEWDRFARRMIAVTGGIRVVITLLLAGILASLS
jgi:hypothetical protein